jgi:hypothetical protein
MTHFERTCLKVAMKHFMADAEDPVHCFDRGMSLLSELSKAPHQGQRAALQRMLEEVADLQSNPLSES